MTDPPTDDTEAWEQDAPDTHDRRQTPRTSPPPRPHRSRASRQGTLRHVFCFSDAPPSDHFPRERTSDMCILAYSGEYSYSLVALRMLRGVRVLREAPV
eukprot:scaffold1491_cov110-Isochrysis_galbana.AAC.6